MIPPEQFGDDEEYEQISLTYYADGVLADENDEVIEDVEDAVGIDSLNHFGSMRTTPSLSVMTQENATTRFSLIREPILR